MHMVVLPRQGVMTVPVWFKAIVECDCCSKTMDYRVTAGDLIGREQWALPEGWRWKRKQCGSVLVYCLPCLKGGAA